MQFIRIEHDPSRRQHTKQRNTSKKRCQLQYIQLIQQIQQQTIQYNKKLQKTIKTIKQQQQ